MQQIKKKLKKNLKQTTRPGLKIKNIEEDIAKQTPFIGGKIDEVGIESLEIPIRIPLENSSKTLSLLGTVKAMVSLDDPNLRGIHMSRIYLNLHDFLGRQTLSLHSLKKLLKELIKSQKGISKTAFLKIEWKWPVKRKALKSDSLEGWRYYPVYYSARLLKSGKIEFKAGLKITYSSTCPCSASLARALIQKKFQNDFSSSKNKTINPSQVFHWLGRESSISATPHAQKSHVFLDLILHESFIKKFVLLNMISEVEKVLGTAVQTAVKKEDEQEFARLNSENLMFSEDAGRRVKNLLNCYSGIKDFSIYVKHFESLHPFEVACLITKKGSV